MTQAQQSEAQRLAAICETKGMFPVADELNRMHARILELEQGKCLHQIAEPAEPSATYGMHFGDRVLHIGGRENAAGYIEFGSVEAVRVLVGQVLRDLPGGAPGFELAATQPAAQGLDTAEYRLIDHGELIEAGDEFLRDDFTWEIDPKGIFVGVPLGTAFRPARRALAAKAKQN